ncbi:N-terminal domain of NEFA-interacting nuclear protein NIP30-domain-containing protein [Lophiotrema nucula]|uniref:N-terminal domain of NEFA-interacting nuclear protein NIP30-domain-containing protein n=1 Tax=Lophiotrema nucula TaxID=690887 RepID=A0A6A5ZLI6_9PLEO|nr:N-terminal domain of NEFA-interacting nuclear protein NIP30-domain-containing protein [Lophiotrema nucula]
MSSGFVSGGTIENPTERDDEWRAAQAAIEEKRLQKVKDGEQEGGKSLFEILQANKAAKQEAFEEATRLKNQFRALDEDEAEFLDSVLEATRKQESEIKKETLEQLDLFRKHQEEAERKALLEANTDGPREEDGIEWTHTGPRKRKKGHDAGLLKGVKLRRGSSTGDNVAEAKTASVNNAGDMPAGANQASAGESGQAVHGKGKGTTAKDPAPKTTAPTKATTAASPQKQPAKPLALNLGYASSDEDD